MPLWSTFAQAVVDRVVEGALHAPDVRSEGVRFARDSPLEGDGFELPVPRELISAGGRNPAASGSTSALDGATRAQLGGAERTVARKWRKTGIFPPFRDAPRVKSVVWRNQVSSKINGLV